MFNADSNSSPYVKGDMQQLSQGFLTNTPPEIGLPWPFTILPMCAMGHKVQEIRKIVMTYHMGLRFSMVISLEGSSTITTVLCIAFKV